MTRWTTVLAFFLLGGVGGVFLADSVLHGQNSAPPAIPKEITSYRGVVKRVLPAVVSIDARAKTRTARTDRPNSRRRSRDNEQIPEELRHFFDGADQSEAPDNIPQGGFGSGFLVDARGVVLTNYHVVGGSDQVEVTLNDGRKFTSKDIHGDRKTDLAIVRIQTTEPLPYLELGDSDQMEIGDRVLAVGAPFGLTGTVTSGIVSAKGRSGLNVNMYEDFIQTDAAINPGNSGGPLVNLEGQVIGINSLIKSRTGAFNGVGLAVASNLVKHILDSLLKDGVVHRGYLGVEIGALTPDVASRLGLSGQAGVVVGDVFDNTPAAKAGIQSGDVITSIAGKPVKDGRDVQRLVADLPLKKPVDVQVFHDGQARTMQVTIEEQPLEYGTTAQAARGRAPRQNDEGLNAEKIGVELQDLNPELADKLGFKEKTNGVIITNVEKNSIASDAGLAPGMLITRVDKQPVKSAEVLRKQLEKGSLDKGILLQVQSPQFGTRYIVLKAEAEPAK